MLDLKPSRNPAPPGWRTFYCTNASDDYTEPLALWTLTALPSGARKSAVFSAMTAPLLRWEKLEYDRGRAERGRVASARKVAEKRIERLLADAAKAKDDHERERIRSEIQHEKDTMPVEIRAPRLFTEDVTAERLQAMLAEYGGICPEIPVLPQAPALMDRCGSLNSGACDDGRRVGFG
ncbi:YfjI family protein, partial [Thauera aromatica]